MPDLFSGKGTFSGRAINPKIVEGQIDGEVFSGMSQVLCEEVLMEDGQALNPSRLDYKMPRSYEVPPAIGEPIREMPITPARYERHRPETTLLYQLVERHYPAFVTALAAKGRHLPGYVEQQFAAYLKKCEGRARRGRLRRRSPAARESWSPACISRSATAHWFSRTPLPQVAGIAAHG